MNPKTYEKLVHVNYSANFPVTSRAVMADFTEYQSPLVRLLNQNLHGWGVASGLEVTATADGLGVQVAAGVALDPRGRILVLATDGKAAWGDATPLTETDVPAIVPTTDSVKGKLAVVTIQFNELRRVVVPDPGQPDIFPGGKQELAPWLRLTPADGFVDSDDVVVLALADVTGDGKVTNVVPAAAGFAPERRRLAMAVGELHIERPARDSAQETTVGVVKPLSGESGLQMVAELASFTGKLGVGQPTPGRTLDVVGSQAIRSTSDGPELIVASSTPGGGGAIETRDQDGHRLVVLTTTDSGADEAGYVGVNSAAGVECASMSASTSGGGRIQVQTRSGLPAISLGAARDADAGFVHLLSDNDVVVMLSSDGIFSRGTIRTLGNLISLGIVSHGGITANGGWITTDQTMQAAGQILAGGALIADGGVVGKTGLWTDGTLFAEGGAVGRGGLWTNGNVQAKGAVFAEGNVQAQGAMFAGSNVEAAGALIANGGAVGKAGLWTDGNVNAKGALFAVAGVVGNAGVWTDGNVQAKGTLFADGSVKSLLTIFTDRNVQAKGTVFADVNVVARGDIFGRTKNFVMTHPKDPSKDIVYSCIEGPEAAAYIRGRAKLQNGRSQVALPEHYQLVVNPDTVTILLTPRLGTSKGLAVAESAADGFTVCELFDGKGSYEFDYFVSGVRKGHEDYQPVVSKGAFASAYEPIDPLAGNQPPGAPASSYASTPKSTFQPMTTAETPEPARASMDGLSGKPEPWNLL